MKLTQLTERYNEAPLFYNKGSTPEMIEKGAAAVVDMIQKQCKPFLDQKRSKINLYRGISAIDPYMAAAIKNVRDDREPRDSSQIQNTFFIDLIAHKGCKANRNNSTFTTTSYRLASDFGSVYVIFPMGEFSFTWGFQDMTEQIPRGEIQMYNVYARQAFIDAHEKQQAAEKAFTSLPKITHQDDWEEVSDEQKEKYTQLAKDLNIWPAVIAAEVFNKLSPSEQRAWDWNACKGLLDKLKDETNSTLSEAMGSSGEIMISCKQYIAVRQGFFEEQIESRLE